MTTNQLTQDLSQLLYIVSGTCGRAWSGFSWKALWFRKKKRQRAVRSLFSNGNAVKTVVLDRFQVANPMMLRPLVFSWCCQLVWKSMVSRAPGLLMS